MIEDVDTTIAGRFEDVLVRDQEDSFQIHQRSDEVYLCPEQLADLYQYLTDNYDFEDDGEAVQETAGDESEPIQVDEDGKRWRIPGFRDSEPIFVADYRKPDPGSKAGITLFYNQGDALLLSKNSCDALLKILQEVPE